MKICLIHSAIAGSSLSSKKKNEVADPTRYISKSEHEFATRPVTYANFESEIDEIVEEGFEFYMNYICMDDDTIAGLEATRYLESKNVSILTGSSVSLAKSMTEIQTASLNAGFKVPKDAPNDSVPGGPAKSTFSVLVVEMGQEVVALTPFCTSASSASKQVPLSSRGLETSNNEAYEFEFVEDEREGTLQRAAERLFKALGLVSNSGWARVELQLEKDSAEVRVIGVSPLPLIFSSTDNISGEDIVIRERFPGGHAALIDMLLATKQMQMKRHQDRTKHIAGVFDEFSVEYDSAWMDSGLRKMQQFLAAEFDYSGSVLDVACGAGAIGLVLHEAGVSAEVTGIDLSKGMLESPYIQNHYKQPIRIGPMQELIMGAGEFDHITCFGSLQFLDRVHLTAVLSRMFMLARKSISFDIDDVYEEYVDLIKKEHGELCFNANHVQAVQEFGVPKGWKLVYNNRTMLFDVPDAGLDVYGYTMRFERV